MWLGIAVAVAVVVGVVLIARLDMGRNTTEAAPASGAACEQSMRKAAAEPDASRADPLIAETLSACETADEWLSTLRDHPAAMGLAPDAEVGETELLAACTTSNEWRRVCRDAADRGLLD